MFIARSLGDAEPDCRMPKSVLWRATMKCLAPRRPTMKASRHFEAGLRVALAALRPRLLWRAELIADYGFLDITKQAFDLSDRGVGGRTSPGSLDAMIFTERGVYRPGRNVYVTALCVTRPPTPLPRRR